MKSFKQYLEERKACSMEEDATDPSSWKTTVTKPAPKPAPKKEPKEPITSNPMATGSSLSTLNK